MSAVTSGAGAGSSIDAAGIAECAGFRWMGTVPSSRKGGILELLDRIEAYVIRHQKLPAALYLELRQAIEELNG